LHPATATLRRAVRIFLCLPITLLGFKQALLLLAIISESVYHNEYIIP